MQSWVLGGSPGLPLLGREEGSSRCAAAWASVEGVVNEQGRQNTCRVETLQYVLFVVCQHLGDKMSHSFTNIFPGFNVKLI